MSGWKHALVMRSNKKLLSYTSKLHLVGLYLPVWDKGGNNSSNRKQKNNNKKLAIKQFWQMDWPSFVLSVHFHNHTSFWEFTKLIPENYNPVGRLLNEVLRGFYSAYSNVLLQSKVTVHEDNDVITMSELNWIPFSWTCRESVDIFCKVDLNYFYCWCYLNKLKSDIWNSVYIQTFKVHTKLWQKKYLQNKLYFHMWFCYMLEC